jgi:mono/diheme cytochrome c family protein
MPVLTNPPTPEKHLPVNLDALKRARDEGRAAGGGSPRWVKAASLLMDAFPALYDTAQRMNADARAMREDLAQLRRQAAELQGQRGVLLGWISAVLPALEVVDALEDFEDGGQALQALRSAGQQLVSTPVRCAACDVPNGCPEFCKCLPAPWLPEAEKYALIEQHLGLVRRRDETVVDPSTGRFTDAARYFSLIDAAIADARPNGGAA